MTTHELPRISIVTPSYNHRPYLSTAIRSVIEQDYANLEYFVMDGGSDDGSKSIIAQYSQGIDYWCSEKDEGQSDAIGRGFSLASGDILGWINSDDAYFPGILERIGRFFLQHPNVGLVTAGTAYTNQEGNITSCYERPKPLLWFAKRGIAYFGQQAMFFRRDIYEQVGGIRRDFHFLMDTELYYRILLSGVECQSFWALGGFFRWHSQMKSIRREGRKADERRIMEEEYGFGLPKYESVLAHILYRTWQLTNGNYLAAYRETNRLRHKSIADIWGWS